jgi:anti-anti-sigma regulatory factor
MQIGVILAAVMSILLVLVIGNVEAFPTALTVLAGLIATQAGAIGLIRGGRFRASALLSAFGLLITLTILSLINGILRNPTNTLSLALPMILVGLLLGRRWLLTFGVASIIIVIVAAAMELFFPPINVSQQSPITRLISVSASFSINIGLLLFLLDRFGGSLREALGEANAREQELEQLRASLERTVAERTGSLQETVNQLRRSQATVQELGIVIMPVLPGVLVAPLIGAIDEQRALAITERLLKAVHEMRAQTVILDITGLTTIDTFVARSLIQTAGAVQLLGSRPVVVGITPEAAQMIVSLGISLGDILVFANLAEAISALDQQHNTESRNYGLSMN